MKTKQKIMAVLMTIILVGSNLITLGNGVIAASLLEQNSKTNHANVEFDSYFENGEHAKTYKVGQEAKLKLKIKVSNTGYLKNGAVQILDANYQIKNSKLESSKVQTATNEQIKLTQIASGEEVIIEVPIQIKPVEQVAKNFLEKTSTVSFTATYVDGNGKEKAIEKTIYNQVKWQADLSLSLNSEVTKYIPYHQGEEYGVLVQTTISSELKDHVLPISKTELTMQVPKMFNTNPQRVTVIANQLASTNGNQNNNIKQNYNQTTGELKLQVENLANAQGNIAWSKQGIDEYVVNFIYVGEELYNQAMQNEFTANMEVTAKITLPDEKQTSNQETINVEYNQKETKGTLTQITIPQSEAISKGYLYANYDKTQNQQETTYNVNYNVQINDSNLTSEVTFQTKPEQYVDQDENTYEVGTGSYTKQVKIAKESFENILGEEGTIEITKKDGTTLGTINKEAELEQENYILNIQEQVSEIIIKTSKPVNAGNLDIQLQKELKAEQNYNKEQMQKMAKITLRVINETETQRPETTSNIEFTEPVSKAEISIEENKQNLSTVVENKNVEMKIVLDTSSTKNALFKNPVFAVELPSQIQKVQLKDYKLVLDDELKIKEAKIVEVNGKQVIQISLEGTQTNYYTNQEQKASQNEISKGANIILHLDITVDKFATTKTEPITMYYKNENTNIYENTYTPKAVRAKVAQSQVQGVAKTNVTILAPTGVVVANGMNGYDAKGSELMNTSSQTQTATIEKNAPKQTVTIKGLVNNNNENSIENVMILGRFPFQGNKVIDETTDLGSTFTMPITQKIQTTGIDESKVKVYYSTSPEATKDLIGSNNNWTAEPANLNEVKSYLIVISGEVAKSTSFNFSYQVELPANLKENSSSYHTYKVYFDNKTETATIGESKLAGSIGVTTGQGPEIEVNVKSTSNTVREGQIIKFTATVKNVGDIKAEKAKMLITAPEGTIHTEIPEGAKSYIDKEETEKIIELGDIAPGATITKEYELRVKKGTTITTSQDESGKEIIIEEQKYPGDKDLQNTVRITMANMSGEIKSEPVTIKVLQGDLSIINTPSNYNTNVFKNGETVKYIIEVKNISYDKDLNNVTLNIPLPSGVKVNNVYYATDSYFSEKKNENITINEKNISINLGTLQSLQKHMENLGEVNEPQIIKVNEKMYVYIEMTLTDFSGTHDFNITAKADKIEVHYANVQQLAAKTAKLKLEQKALDNMYIKEGSNYTYHFTLENTGEISSVQNEVEIIIPEGVSLEKAEYSYQSQTKAETTVRDGKVKLTIGELKANKKIDIAVTVKANLLPNKNDKEVTTYAIARAKGIENIESNKVKAIIEYDENAHKTEQGGTSTPNTPNTPSNSTYKIMGTAWIDANKNGKRDETEELLSDVDVILLYKSNSQIVKDETTGVEKVTTTNSDGKYQFDGLKPNDYLVVFLYDAGKYSITDYQKQGVEATLNSDATSMKIILEGKQKQAGVTNTIKITNSNIRDIDLGVYVAEKFDLKLDKYISKMTVTTPSKGTKVINANNSKLQKVEVAKKDIGNSNVIIEYTIVVTNEGQVPGYVKKIIDYLPEGTKFSSELNKDWYISNQNGMAFNTSLANTLLQPGESKQVTIILSTQITNKNIGNIISNNAEIYESYNEQGIEDMDSIVANKLETEDDMSNADIILAIATGSILLYTSLTLAVIAIVTISIIMIKKNVLNKKV